MALRLSGGVMYGQIAGFLVAFISTITCTVTCVWNQWSKTSSAASTSLLNSIWGFNGIWIQCLQYTAGQFQCDDYQKAIFDLATYVTVIRAMMCIGIIFSVFGCFGCLVGMQCSRLFDSSPNIKRKIMQITGVMFIVVGVLTTASIIWFIVMIIQEFFSYANQDNMLRYTLGATIYVGIFSAIISFAAGIIFLCIPGPKEQDEAEAYLPYTTRPSAYPLNYNTNSLKPASYSRERSRRNEEYI